VCCLAVAFSACGFPTYTFGAATGGNGGGAGTAGLAGMSMAGYVGTTAGAAGTTGGAAGAGAAAGVPDSGGAGSGGTAGGAGLGGWAGTAASCNAQAGSPAEPLGPPHCSNGNKDQDETGTDCGGSSCHPCFHDEGCKVNADCISGACSATSCVQLIELDTSAVIATRSTFTIQFEARIDYLETTLLPLKDISLRYYFARGDTIEPIVPYATQALLNGASVDAETHWELSRVIADPSALVDTYMEITFPNSKKMLLQNDELVLTQSIQSAVVSGHAFDQLTHYSFQSDQSLQPNEHVTAYRKGVLMWGTPPVYTLPAQCFYAAVSFAGSAFATGSGMSFVAGSDSRVHFSGTTSQFATSPYPSPASELVPMLESAVNLDTAHATFILPNDKYWVYPYVVSEDGDNQADLSIQGQPVSTFLAGDLSGGPAWARLGPFPVTVSTGALDFSSPDGPLRLAGVEIYQAAQ
jgi:hypothetical protein